MLLYNFAVSLESLGVLRLVSTCTQLHLHFIVVVVVVVVVIIKRPLLDQ